MELETSRRTSPEMESLSADSAMADELESGGGRSTEEVEEDSMDEDQGEGQELDVLVDGDEPIDLTNCGSGSKEGTREYRTPFMLCYFLTFLCRNCIKFS